MEYLTGLLQNKVLIAALAGWFTAQVLKTVIYMLINRQWRIERMWGSGGMPSSHSAMVCAMTVSAAINYGTASFEFALSIILTAIVLHDARGVRLETGRQAVIINDIIAYLRKDPESQFPQTALKELVGHTPLQVIVGCVIGIIAGLVIR